MASKWTRNKRPQVTPPVCHKSDPPPPDNEYWPGDQIQVAGCWEFGDPYSGYRRYLGIIYCRQLPDRLTYSGRQAVEDKYFTATVIFSADRKLCRLTLNFHPSPGLILTHQFPPEPTHWPTRFYTRQLEARPSVLNPYIMATANA